MLGHREQDQRTHGRERRAPTGGGHAAEARDQSESLSTGNARHDYYGFLKHAQVNGVLTERTVGEVLPLVSQNYEGVES